jgi:glycosyltransferase involved in cell wall biosynthesis
VRIVLVNWAPIERGAQRGGGVNGYCQSLGLELRRRGHDVTSLCGGMTYESAAASVRVEGRGSWEGIRVFEVINSPVLAPSLAQFRDPRGEIAAPALEAAVSRLIGELRPDLVHFHNIEGFSAGCVGAVRRGRPAARVVYSLHNYHTICPQVYLLQGHRRACWSFDNGHACAGCIQAPDPAEERARLTRLRADEAETEPVPVRKPAPVSMAAASSSDSGLPPRFVPGRGPHPWYGDDVPAWRPLLNVVKPEPPSHKPPNDYAHRRAAMIGMLNSCDRVLAVSSFVARKFAAMGVGEDRLRVVPIGSRMTEVVGRTPCHAPGPLVQGGRLVRPINLAFMGYNNWYKGLPMLADALDLLTPEVLSNFHLHVYALQGEQTEPILRTIEPRLAGLTLRHGYRYEEVPELLSGIDLGIVPSVWWDNGPQTVMEFFACGIPVLAAELGGIPDLVRDGQNGMLFVGNHRWDLARRLAQIARDPALLPKLRSAVRPPRTMSEHTDELERVYAGTLS